MQRLTHSKEGRSMRSKAGPGKRSRAISRRTRRSSIKARIAVPEVAVTFRHVEPTEALRAYAVRKLSHPAKFLKRPCQVHLILTVDKYRHRGEVTLKSGYLAVAAQEETKDLYSVIDLLADKVERQLKSHRGKSTAKKLRAPSAGELMSNEQVAPDPDSTRI
jgi:ribosomal subunit interface protein